MPSDPRFYENLAYSLESLISEEEHSRNRNEAADRIPGNQLNLNYEVNAKITGFSKKSDDFSQ